MKGLG